MKSPDPFSARTARWLVSHGRAVWIAVACATVAATLLIFTRVHFASDVLDLLPDRFASVQIFRIFDREFSQARELTFALHDPKKECDLEAFGDHFADGLRKEPWVLRVLDRPPVESLHGMAEVQGLAAPLLMNLRTPEFAGVMESLNPEKIRQRLKKLRAEMEAGSPRAEATLAFDPLGIVGPALKPLAGSFSLEQGQPLASADGTLRVVLAITRETDLSARACQATMRRVETFREQVLDDWPGPRPEILVTGRTAYVGELSLTMHADVMSTMGSSVLMVAALFWVAFRRVRPLLAMVHVLVLACLFAVAAAALVFGELNMITIGLCAMLFGLGEDFGMMLLTYYNRARAAGAEHGAAIAAALAHHGGGVIFGALTTASAFLCLLRSECAGFAQLGVLIAVGILLAAGLMMTAFFVFCGAAPQPPLRDFLVVASEDFSAWVVRHPRRFTLISLVVLGLGAAAGYGPVGTLPLATHPRSLEPANSQAGYALRTIQSKLPATGEPVLAVRHAGLPGKPQATWEEIEAAWRPLLATGDIRSLALPTAFLISPERVRANAAAMLPGMIREAVEAFRKSLQDEGFNKSEFESAFALLKTLDAGSQGDFRLLTWNRALPPESSWWFLLDRFLGRDGNVTAGYVTPAQKPATPEAAARLAMLLQAERLGVGLSGWTFTLAELVTWARAKVWELSAMMIALNSVLLWILFRRAGLVALLLMSLAMAMGCMLVTLKVFGVPLNLFNVLAFPLVLGVGVDYGIYVALAAREPGNPSVNLSVVFKPVLLSGLTTVAGFGSLAWAQNPALRGLGIVCGVGIAWCLVTTFLFVMPAAVWWCRRFERVQSQPVPEP